MDGGVSWTSARTGYTGDIAVAIAVEPSAPATVWVGSNSGVFRSIDGGAGWSDRSANLPNRRVLALANGIGHPVPIADDTGSFWFFGPANLELMIKVLDGRGVNGRYWVFFGALSDVEYEITVTDTATGAVRTYRNEQGTLASIADTSAF